MDRVEQKRNARHVRSKQARHDRFITAYVMKKNKEVYAEVKELYDELDKRYPTKRDLTKTDEFKHEITGYTSLYKWNIAKLQTRKQESNNQKDMSLEIQLMNKDDVDMTVMCEKASEEISIPDNIYNDLVTEISNDPTMSTIFNDLNNEQNEQDEQQQQELSDILEELDDILPPEKSPLEDELENIVYE